MFCKPTTNHQVIRYWAKLRGAHPAERLPGFVDGEQPILTFVFHRASQEQGRVIPLSWEDFFDRFDLLDLAFMAEDEDVGSLEYRLLYRPAPEAEKLYVSQGKSARRDGLR